MAESPEYRVIVNCMKKLETSLLNCDRDVIHFLLQEGFISTEVHDDVLNPRLLGEHQKAGELVSGIRRKVALSSMAYHTLVDYLGQSGKQYEGIVAMLKLEYTRQQLVDTSLEQIRGIKMSHVLLRYREYLKSYYKNYSIALDDKLSIAPCSEFISLALVLKQSCSSYDDFSKSTFHGQVDEIVAAKRPLAINALFESSSRFILVEGAPGIGKSTLCWELCRKWDFLESLQDFKIVLQLKLREERIQNASKLHELFYHEDERLSQSVAEEVLECEGEGVLLILDGFDEMPTSVVHNKHNLIMKLIDSKCLPKTTCLVTSRPSALHHKAKFPTNYRHVEILGFTDESKVKYAEIAFEKNPDILTHFKSFIFSNPIVKSLMYIPINCAIITQVYQDIGFRRDMLPKTMTQLYSILVLVYIRRHMIYTGEWDEDCDIPNKLEELPGEISSALQRVSKLAYRGLLEYDAKLVFSASEVGRDFNNLSLMSVSREMYVVSGTKVTYSFFHLSMQEFLAAWYTSQHPELIEHVRIKYIDEQNRTPWYSCIPAHLNAYVRFVSGLVQGLSKVLKSPIYSAHMILLHCYFEAQNPFQDEKLLRFHHAAKIQNSLDGYVFGYVLTHANTLWDIEISTKALDALLSSLYVHPDKCQPVRKISNFKLTALDGHFSNFMHSSSILETVSCFELFVHRFACIESVAGLISTMCKLSSIKVLISHSAQHGFQSDCMLFKSLQALQTLKTVEFNFSGYTMSPRGVNELKIFFQPSTLDTVELFFQNLWSSIFVKHDTMKFVPGNSYHSIIESVLSSPTLTSFTTNIPFVASKLPRSLKNLHFKMFIRDQHFLGAVYRPIYTLTIVRNCLYCIAGMCGDVSLQNLTIDFTLDMTWGKFTMTPGDFCNFLSILNKSVGKNSTKFGIRFKKFGCGNLLNHISVLSHSLGSSCTEVQKTRIRKSKSLCDLTEVCDMMEELPLSVSKCRSCPDLFDLQRLHTLHPQLHTAVYPFNFQQLKIIQRCKTISERKVEWKIWATMTNSNGFDYSFMWAHK